MVRWASPESVADWLALIALLATIGFGLVSLLALSWSAWRYATTEWEKAQRAKAERLQDLAKFIYNKDHAFGLGSMLLAIDELRRYKSQSRAVGRFVDVLRRDYEARGEAKELIDALDDVDAELGRKK